MKKNAVVHTEKLLTATEEELAAIEVLCFPKEPRSQLVEPIKEEDCAAIFINEAVIDKIFEEGQRTLTAKLEEMQTASDERVTEIQIQCQEKLDEREQLYAKQMLKIINYMDQIAAATTGVDSQLAEQLQKIIQPTLVLLTEMGIEEVPTLGLPVDGDYMNSIGTIDRREEAAKGLVPFEVAVVFQRAFRFSKTGEMLQDALVKTVAE